MNVKGKSYDCQKGRPWLKPGTMVMVEPGSIATEPYQCIIVEEVVKWTYGIRQELCTHYPGGYSSVIWEYWVDRLTPINQ